MRLELTGRHVEITPALRRVVASKLARLERLLNDSALSAQVVLTSEKRARRADVTLHARGEKFLHGVGGSPVWETSLAEAVDKIAQQGQRLKGKWQERKRRGKKASFAASEPLRAEPPTSPAPKRARPRPGRVVRIRRPIVPMSVADATRGLGADGVVVFRNLETAAVAVLFRRLNGDLVLFDTEA